MFFFLSFVYLLFNCGLTSFPNIFTTHTRTLRLAALSKRIRHSALRRLLTLRELCEKNNLRFCDVHSFRHAHASILINAGVDVATVSADLGHSNSMTTLSIYTHEFQDAQARTSDIVANALDFSKKKESAVS